MKQKLSIITSIIAFTFCATPNGVCQWTKTTFPDDHTAGVTSFAVNDSNIFCGTDGDGVFASTDGVNWKGTGTGLQGTPYSNIVALAAIGPNLLATASIAGIQTIGYLSTNNGFSWNESSGAPSVSGVVGSSLFGGDGGGNIYLSQDSGVSWEWVFVQPNGGDKFIQCFTQFDTNIVGGFNRSFYTPQPPAEVLYSRDKGVTWNQVNGDISSTVGMTGTRIRALATIGNNLFAGTDSGVFRSTNYGLWTKVNNGLPYSLRDGYSYHNVTSFAVSGSNLFATLDGNIFLSTNFGTSWDSVNEGMPDTFYVIHLVVFGSNLYADEVDAGGIWRRPLSDFGISSVTQTPPSPPQIQSYPNPFSQLATVNFTTEAQGCADVRVENLLGAPVALLYSGELSAGEHEFSWDASGVAPGMYECVVRENGQVQRVSLSHIP